MKTLILNHKSYLSYEEIKKSGKDIFTVFLKTILFVKTEFFVKFINSTADINDFLLTSEEWVAF